MTQTQLSMADLYERLADIGISKAFARKKLLPDWWTDEVDQTPGVLMEGAMYISHRLNLDIKSLLTNESSPRFINTAQPKFKTRDGTEHQKIALPRALAARIAELIAHACINPYQSIEHLSIPDIRQKILQHRLHVDLPGFLDFCWEHGIPVIHFAQFPPKVHRFQGMVAIFHGRPVILISLKDQLPARLLFIAAHELGHITKGHLSQEGLLVDEDIQLESDDTEENEANQFATELLLGRSGISYDLLQKHLKSEALAQKATLFGQRDQVDPGVVAFNITWNKAQRATTSEAKRIAWATGTKAAQILEPNINAIQQINQKIFPHLDLTLISEENQDYLVNMLGISMDAE